VVKEGKEKEEHQGKVSLRVVGSAWKSLSGRHVPSSVSSLTTLCMPGHFAVALRMPSVSVPLAPRNRVVATSCRTRHPRVLYASPFSWHPVGTRSHAIIPVPDPSLPLFFSSFGDTVVRMPSPPSESPPLSLILPLLAYAGSAP